MEDSNNGLEIKEDAQSGIIEKGIQMINNPDKLKNLHICKEDKVLVLHMTMSYGYPLHLKLRLVEGSKEFFFQKVTQCLLKTVCDLKLSEQKLRNLLIKKDNEIEEYKLEGGEISLRHLKTAKYNDNIHTDQHNVYNCNFGLLQFPHDLLQKSVDLPERIKKESGDATLLKTEPNTSLLESQNVPETVCVKEEVKTEAHPNIYSPIKRQKKVLNL